MAEHLLIGVDVGTSGVDACAFTLDGALTASTAVPLLVAYPRPGWAEQDAAAWPRAAETALRRLAAQLGSCLGSVAAIGLTGQCPSFALLDDTATPLTPGLIHQDNRATAELMRITDTLGVAEVRVRTGLAPSQFYVAPKAMWLGTHDHALRARRPWLAQPRDMVAQRLTGVLATDATHAGCTGLYDLAARDWAHDWRAPLDLDWLRLPPVLSSAAQVGGLTRAAADATGLPAGLPVVIGAADNFCADLALGAVRPGLLGDTSGTTTCLDLTVEGPRSTHEGVSSPLSYYAHFSPDRLFVNAGLSATGGVIAWAAAILAGGDVARLEALASSAVPDAAAPLLLPYLAGGDRTDAAATGVWYGLALSHDSARLARSVYEGLAFALRDLVEAFRGAGYAVAEARIGGGGSRSALWNALKADVWGVPVRTGENADATALGAALLAGLGIALYRDVDDAVARAVRLTPARPPAPERRALYDQLYHRWRALTLR